MISPRLSLTVPNKYANFVGFIGNPEIRDLCRDLQKINCVHPSPYFPYRWDWSLEKK